jgi:predicted metalloprotease with PDZ domain
MIQYFFSFNFDQHLVNIEIIFENVNSKTLELHLPKWRPGRYQFQNFAKNILNFEAKDHKNQALTWTKISTNVWSINQKYNKTIIVNYAYYANELNAGSSLVNNNLQYINPINLCLYVPECVNNQVIINISRQPLSKIACGLDFEETPTHFITKPINYHQLFDSPIIISEIINHAAFTTKKVKFNFWTVGNIAFEFDKFLEDLEKICHYQINLFGGFPEKNYHFLLIIPALNYYHGVEHANSTMMVIGENGQLTQDYYYDLLGLASHELFHAWNIAKIRPKELLPYNYQEENYFNTCFVAEGYTTYYGDKIMYEARVITQKQYEHELETTYRRHFEEADYASQSLLESSFDLWVDGYDKGTPNKKVSVYHKGAIAAQILDIIIKRKFEGKKSLDDVIRKLWKDFGKNEIGYTYKDIKAICEDIYEENLDFYFDRVISSNTPILTITNEYLKDINLKISRNINNNIILSHIK